MLHGMLQKVALDSLGCKGDRRQQRTACGCTGGAGGSWRPMEVAQGIARTCCKSLELAEWAHVHNTCAHMHAHTDNVHIHNTATHNAQTQTCTHTQRSWYVKTGMQSIA